MHCSDIPSKPASDLSALPAQEACQLVSSLSERSTLAVGSSWQFLTKTQDASRALPVVLLSGQGRNEEDWGCHVWRRCLLANKLLRPF